MLSITSRAEADGFKDAVAPQKRASFYHYVLNSALDKNLPFPKTVSLTVPSAGTESHCDCGGPDDQQS